MTAAVIGLGTNLGARRALLLGAIQALGAREGLEIVARSELYETPPLGPPQPDFLNAALRIEWTGTPLSLLSELHAVERLLGRERRERWGPRTIDLDLLWWGEGEVDEPTLRVPHPGLPLRNFALAPLLDVLPEQQSAFAATLLELGGPPRTLAWPLVDVQDERLTIFHCGDETDAISLALSSVLTLESKAAPRTAQRFEVPAGDLTAVAQACLDQAEGAGFAASWACLLQGAPNAPLHGVFLGQVSARCAPPRIAALAVEHCAESSKAIIHIRERA